MSTEVNLRDGFWVPSLHFCAHPNLVKGERGALPGGDATPERQRQLRNDGNTIMIVRAFTFLFPAKATITVGDPLDDVQKGLGAYIRMRLFRRDREVVIAPDLYACPIGLPQQSSDYGNGENYPYIYRLAAPLRLAPGESVVLRIGCAESATDYEYSAAASASMRHCVFAKGVQSDRPYQFGGAMSSALSEYTTTHQNLMREPIDIYALSVTVGVQGDYPLLRVWGPQGEWSSVTIPMHFLYSPLDLISSVSFALQTWDLSGLPEGGVVMFPGDYWGADIMHGIDTVAQTLPAAILMEAYRRVA
jgi:hypothetical protein